MNEAWIIDAVRTPRSAGKFGKGELSHLHPQHLMASVLGEISRRNQFNTEDVDDVIAGCGMQAGKQSFCVARSAALLAGWSTAATGFTVDRFCGSALTAVNLAAMGIMSGMQDVVVAGGVEMMSYYARLFESGYPIMLTDADNPDLRRLYPTPNQGVCADVIASMEGFARIELDEYAVESQRRAAVAVSENRFAKSLIPVLNADGSIALDREAFLRPETSLEGLQQLKPSFAGMFDVPFYEERVTSRQMVNQRWPDLNITHVHHAGNSSGLVDGASAVLVVSRRYAEAHGLKPRARIKAFANGGCEPELMLNAPVPAAKAALRKAGMKVGDVDIFEINEAFAVVPLKFIRDLDIDPLKVNVNGGAIALGHPIGATGAMILGTALDELERREQSVALITMCTAGGMAPATIIERV